jgi:hypothetical protein
MAMDSTWNGHGFHMESFHGINMESTWNPYGIHGIYLFHVDSMWIPYGIPGEGKVLFGSLLFQFGRPDFRYSGSSVGSFSGS